jgi:cysteine-rich repeat protein
MSSLKRTEAHPVSLVRHLPLWTLVALAMSLAGAGTALARDRQLIAPGFGSPSRTCVAAGVDGNLDSTRAGDDVIETGGLSINTGANGVCETIVHSQDIAVYGIAWLRGLPDQPVVEAGTPSNAGNGICDLVGVTVGGDDGLLVPSGNSRPRMVAVYPGIDNTLQTTVPAGDDKVTAVICPDDNQLDSTVDPNDTFVLSDTLCSDLCSGGGGCIVARDGDGIDEDEDDVLQTVAHPADRLVPYVSSGGDGIVQTARTVVSDDVQLIPVGQGWPFTICVNAGPNGIAETSVCGNGREDIDENGQGLAGANECDDGNLISGDGCAARIDPIPLPSSVPVPSYPSGCVIESGWSCDAGEPSVCTPICGDGLVRGSEPCDDGNGSNQDNCLNICQLATCGDGFVHSQGTGPFEQCDDGNTTSGDGCTATCQDESCGDGIVNDGGAEECDDGNSNNNDACPTNCQNAECGDGFIHIGFEQCDDGNTTSGDCCSSTCQNETDGNACDDGSACTTSDLCLNGVCQGDAQVCGDGVVQGSCGEQCDDGNTTSGDGCTATCQDESCGDGVVNDGGAEECDDGNNNNNDACVQGCKNARCGDGFKRASVEECDDGCLAGTPNVCEPVDNGDGCSSTCTEERPVRCGNGVLDRACSEGNVGVRCSANVDCDTSPGNGVCVGEQCDDGNRSNRDDCLNTCELAVCGDGHVHDKGSGTEECDDDNTAPGDGCSPTCTLECGNGVLDRACSEGNVGAGCSANADCDTSPGNGVCVGEQCDPGKTCIGGFNNGAPCSAASQCPNGKCAPIFCISGPQVCSAVCLVATCGNGAVECTEECDLGSANGVLGSGCTAACQRNLVGGNELKSIKECPSAWTLDSPPRDLKFRKQVCVDGAACDFDLAVNGHCAFKVGVCLNRLGPAGCVAGGIQTLDLLRLKFEGICTAGKVGARCFDTLLQDDCETTPGADDGVCSSHEADAAADLTDAVRLLAPDIATVPDRCRAGLKGKVCSIPDDNECDRAFGAGDGLCDIGAGVEFHPPLDAGDQVTACTESVNVVVDAGAKLKLRSNLRRTTGPPDKDMLLLQCAPAP